jgi:hypothetical protein
VDSSCELLSSLDPASGSVHCCKVSCRTARSISRHQGGDVQRRASGLSGGVRLTEKTREAHRWMCMYGEARRAMLVTPTCTGAEKDMVLNASGFCPQLGQLSHTHAPSEQQVHSKVSLRRAVDAV